MDPGKLSMPSSFPRFLQLLFPQVSLLHWSPWPVPPFHHSFSASRPLSQRIPWYFQGLGSLQPLPLAVSCTFFFFLRFHFFLAASSLYCWAGVFSSCGQCGLLSSCSIQVSHFRHFSCPEAQALGLPGSRVHAQGTVAIETFSYSASHGIFPDQGSNPCPLYWQGDFYPLDHQGSPCRFLYQKQFVC